jgi:hypothetical protein
MYIIDTLAKVAGLLNNNQGVVSALIFIITMLFGWISGIFSALRRKPKFKISAIPGPTFCCTFPIGQKHGDFDVHRTGFALYLHVSNVGSSPSSIDNISRAYHWNLKPFSMQWLRYTVGWFWITDQAVALSDFQVLIGDNTKVYPFLTQKSSLSIHAGPETFLESGRSTNGVVYFEQLDSWGGCFPRVRNNSVRLKIAVRDVFGKEHYAKVVIPAVSLEEARKYNPTFGKTLAELRNQPLPFDLGVVS